MQYIGTRGNYPQVTAAPAIKMGMVPSGGLFVPSVIPQIDQAELEKMVGLSYQELAEKIISLYLTDYSPEEIKACVQAAYGDNFDDAQVAPLHKLNNTTHILELWHGPTAAFKDMALQILPQFLSRAISKVDGEKEVVILVATSGDTGKAALEGFKNVPGIKIIVFYPNGGVSKVQEFQMNTTEGDNTYVVAVEGNFDDCQTAVKEIFADQEYKVALAQAGFELSSANSINWGRLLPQIVYYFSSYLYMVRDGQIQLGDKINFVVPTGNFGNILAGYYAHRMGLPVHKFICASNENKVLADFLATGTYDRNREFMQTNSPSMDILISSNLERFLFELNGHNEQLISEWYQKLNQGGQFTIDADTKAAMEGIMLGGFTNQEETLATIQQVFAATGYTLDTHTAVAVKVYQDYVAKTGDNTKTVIDSTASPFKFNTSVLQAIKGCDFLQGKTEFEMLDDLSEISGLPIHPGLRDLDKKPVRHGRKCDKTEIQQQISNILGL